MYAGSQDDLTAQEAIALEYDFGSRLFVADNYLQQYEWGFLSDSFWARTVIDMKCYLEHPFYREAISRGWLNTYRAEFKAIIEQWMEEVADNPSGCWDFEFQYQLEE